MYIPVMAFVTYILLSTLLAGLRGQFHPEVMGLTATTAFVVVLLEILGLKFGTYVLSINNESQLLDLVAYSGYKFVGVIVTLVVSETLNRGQGTGGWAGWTVFTYTFMANAFFLVGEKSLQCSMNSELMFPACSSGPSNTSSYPTLPPPPRQAVVCTQSLARSETDAHNSSLSTATSCNSSSCGFCHGKMGTLHKQGQQQLLLQPRQAK